MHVEGAMMQRTGDILEKCKPKLQPGSLAPIISESTTINGDPHGEKGTLLHCCWEWKPLKSHYGQPHAGPSQNKSRAGVRS